MNKGLSVDPFIIPVNEWGLPHPHLPRENTAILPNVMNVKNTTLCKLYWLLKEMNIEYQYVTESERRVNTATLVCPTEPKYRLIQSPKLVYEAIQGSYSAYAQIDFSKLTYFKAPTKTLQLCLDFTETDIWSHYTLTTKPSPTLKTLHSLSLEVLETQSILFYLQSNKEDANGMVLSLKANSVFFEPISP